ncbi:N-acetylglucosaminyl transferase component-domain-containing protein [Zopfochytrium polystomum]|nr:N-acetylglucosaminyl transferase component-domain-containing protein [Zopfochytrium polystomum]
MVNILFSLFQLFRGRKLNVLRDRVDSAEFDLDQLLLGTILFTVIVFLLPTVAVYYILFSLIRVAVLSIQSVIEIALAILNHFPLFAIMLRFKDPHRLPSGVQFQLLSDSKLRSLRFWGFRLSTSRVQTEELSQNVYLYMKNVPISVSRIFYQYHYLFGRASKYYLSFPMTKSFFTGRRLESLPHLQVK